MQMVFIALTSFISSFVQSTTGFGYGILFMAISPYFLPLPIAMVLSVATSLFGNVANVSKRLKKINFKQILIPVAFASTTTYLSIYLAQGADLESYRRILGVLLFALAIWFIFFSHKVKIKPSKVNCAIAGLLSGVGSGLFSISGPPMVVYYLSATSDKEEYMATIQGYFLLNGSITLIMRYLMGQFEAIPPSWFLISVFGLACGVLLGSRVYSKLNAVMVKRCVYAFMALSGLFIALGI